jgi:putative ABC transport system substrate-binding protein
MADTGARLGVAVVEKTVDTRADIQAAMDSLEADGIDGLVVLPDTFTVSNADLLLKGSYDHQVPAIGVHDYLADYGMLAAYGTYPDGAGDRLADYLLMILHRTNPGDIPIETRPPNFTVNVRSAACMGISVPQEILDIADRVIE